jgi:hypothetical protein
MKTELRLLAHPGGVAIVLGIVCPGLVGASFYVTTSRNPEKRAVKLHEDDAERLRR